MADYTQPDAVSKRVRFFDGQFLQDQDFVDEQKFHLDRQRRQSRLLRLTGVCAGLTVTAGEPFQLTVAAGTAVDALGRHLVLAGNATLPLDEGFTNQQNIEVHLVHQESATDVEVSARRWDESPKVVVIAPNGSAAVDPGSASPELDGPTVLLGRLAVAENGDITVAAGAAHLSSLSVSGSLGIGTAEPGSDLGIGAFDPRDRHLTFAVAGGNRYRSGIRLWAGAANQGYSVEYDQRLTAGQGLHVRTHDQDADGTTRLFVGTGGDIGIGTTAPANEGGWGRVVDVVGAASTKLSVRTANVAGGVLAHDQGVLGAPAGLVVGTTSNSPLSLVTNGATRLTVDADGDVALGSAPFSARWTRKRTSSKDPADPYLLLRRTDPGSGGKRLFLELFQGHDNPDQPDVYPSIRFHHSARFWHRLEGQADGLHVKIGRMDSDEHSGLHAGSLTIGSVTIGEKELKILKKLANNELVCELRNDRTNAYVFDSEQKRGSSSYFYTLMWRPGQPTAPHTHTFWKFEVTDR